MTKPSQFQLFLSQRSPFARRIRLALERLDLPFTEKPVNVFEENPELLAANPLGMVPTLMTPEGRALFDSATILEYLDDLTGKIWPKDFHARTEMRQAATLAEGIIQSSVLFFQETKMHEVPSPTWTKDHYQTMELTLKHIACTPSHLWIQNGELTQAGWDLAVAIEYLALRIPELKWQELAPAISNVLTIARENSDFCQTSPKA